MKMEKFEKQLKEDYGLNVSEMEEEDLENLKNTLSVYLDLKFNI